MTSKEFVIWMKGFAEACNDFHPTPKQWDTIKEELNNVNDANTKFGTASNGILNIANPVTSATYATIQSGSWHYTTNGIEEKVF